jgi:hypothetical protein
VLRTSLLSRRWFEDIEGESRSMKGHSLSKKADGTVHVTGVSGWQNKSEKYFGFGLEISLKLPDFSGFLLNTDRR